jgi:hypothetical protein
LGLPEAAPAVLPRVDLPEEAKPRAEALVVLRAVGSREAVLVVVRAVAVV